MSLHSALAVLNWAMMVSLVGGAAGRVYRGDPGVSPRRILGSRSLERVGLPALMSHLAGNSRLTAAIKGAMNLRDFKCDS